MPCVRDQGSAVDDSLAQNDQRVGLHPLEQFSAFHALRESGMSEDEIAARHFVTPAVVKQRLRFASISPSVLDIYASDGMTLEQLMAFAVAGDHPASRRSGTRSVASAMTSPARSAGS